MNTMQLFDQDKIWYMSGHIPIKLVDMDPHHRRATLNMLRKRARYTYFQYSLVEMHIMDSAPEDVQAQWDREQELAIEDGPEAWLERRPLVMELARLVREDESVTVDGEIVPEKPELTVGQRHLCGEIVATVCKNVHEYPNGCTDECFTEE